MAIIVITTLAQKSELERQKSVEAAQSQFRRDLHDSVAQDLAAAKIFLDKNDGEKARHYLDCALNETRYLIDSLSTEPAAELSEPIDALIRKNLASFERNWGIASDVFIASDRLSRLSVFAQGELLKIIQ